MTNVLMRSPPSASLQQGARTQALYCEYRDPTTVLLDGGDGVLGMIVFGGGAAPPTPGCPVLSVPFSILGEGAVAEVWRSNRRVAYEQDANVRVAHDGNVMFATCSLPERGNLEQASEHAYRTLLARCESAGYPHVLRMWNHFHDINGEEQGLERYRRFNVGRHRALAERLAAGWTRPAASAVGTAEPGFHVYLIASREPGTPIENPRQIRAYEYPATYGPRPPDFSRAMRVTLGPHSYLFISGTAAILGHLSRHPGDPCSQLEESLANIQALLAVCGSSSLAQLHALKLYVRGQPDADVVQRLRGMLPAETPALLVAGDICRKELSVEVEAFAVLA